MTRDEYRARSVALKGRFDAARAAHGVCDVPEERRRHYRAAVDAWLDFVRLGVEFRGSA
ncbi:hypothetical protein [Gordonia sp. NPDC003422]